MSNVTIEANNGAAVVCDNGIPVGTCRLAFVHLHNALCELGFIPVFMSTGFVRYQPKHNDSPASSLRPVLAIRGVQGGEIYLKRCKQVTDGDINGLHETAQGSVAFREIKRGGRRVAYTGSGDDKAESLALCCALNWAKVDGGTWQAVAKHIDASASEATEATEVTEVATSPLLDANGRPFADSDSGRKGSALDAALDAIDSLDATE